MRARLAVCNIAVQDVPRSRQFYETLGFQARPESNDEMVFFELEWSWLAIFTYASLARFSGTPLESAGPPAFCLSHFVQTSKEVDEVISRAVSAGGSVAIEPANNDHGRIGYFSDPDGYRWEVAYSQHWMMLAE